MVFDRTSVDLLYAVTFVYVLLGSLQGRPKPASTLMSTAKRTQRNRDVIIDRHDFDHALRRLNFMLMNGQHQRRRVIGRPILPSTEPRRKDGRCSVRR